MMPLRFGARAGNPGMFLFLGAHCDDIEIGCGATVMRLIEDYPDAAFHWVVFSSDERRAAETRRAAGVLLKRPVLDTMLLSAILHPHQSSHSLDTLLSRFGIPPAERHTALGDALMTADLLVCLLPLLQARGITTLTQALQASQRTPLARLTYD